MPLRAQLAGKVTVEALQRRLRDAHPVVGGERGRSCRSRGRRYEPPSDISGTNASASTFNEYVEMCRATATSSQVAPMKLSPTAPVERSRWRAARRRHAPSGRPRLHARCRRAVSSVTSSSRTGMSSPPGNLRAVRLVRLSPRPAPVSTRSAPSSRATRGDHVRQRCVGQHPGDDDVLAVEEPHRTNVALRDGYARLDAMRIGILGGTGPAGSGLPPASPASATRRSSGRAEVSGDGDL